MTEEELEEKNWFIEEYGDGFIIADYSGRGKFGAMYCGNDEVWKDQPCGLSPFATKEQIFEFATAKKD